MSTKTKCPEICSTTQKQCKNYVSEIGKFEMCTIHFQQKQRQLERSKIKEEKLTPKKLEQKSSEKEQKISVEKEQISPTEKEEKLVPCLSCKGTKVTKITIAFSPKDSGRTSELDCIDCDGKGTMTQKQVDIFNFEKNMWCECKRDNYDSDDDIPIYHKDGKTPWEWCVYKHHYHCRICKKIVQIG